MSRREPVTEVPDPNRRVRSIDESADTAELDFSAEARSNPPRSLNENLTPAQDEEPVVQTIVSTLRSWKTTNSHDQQETARQLREQQQKVLDTVKRLAATEALAESIIETAPDAFIGIDLEGRIINWNAQAATILGWSKVEALGTDLWKTIFPSVFREVHRRNLKGFRNNGERVISHRMELTARRRDGHSFPVEVTVSGPIQNDAGYFFGTFLRDISKRKEREEELRKAKESAQSQARSLKLLNGISRELSALVKTDDLLKRIGELLYQLIEYHSFSVLMLDASGKHLKPIFSLTGADVISKPPLSIDGGIIGFAARTRQPVVVGDVLSDPRYIKFHDETRSELSVPLIVKDKLIGVLDIENTTAHYFNDDHVQAVAILAPQLAIALDNAMLYDRVSAHEKLLDEDLRFARKIQKRLLTDELPPMFNARVSNLSWPARIIGGDIYEFSYYPRTKTHVGILGDVTGKGAAAALYAALMSGLIRPLMDQELFPAQMLKRLNDALMERPLESHFVALMYALWDDANKRLYIANSGLPRPIRFTNGKMSIIDAVGTPLGLLPDLDFDEHQIEAQSGDVFLFPTDGVLEALNDEEQEFGYSGIENVLKNSQRSSAEEIKEALARALASHCEGVEYRDDQTLVVLKVR